MLNKKEAQEIIEGLITAVSHFDYLTNSYNAKAKPAVKDAQEFLKNNETKQYRDTIKDIFATDTVDLELWDELDQMDDGQRIDVPLCVFDLKRIRFLIN